MQQQLFRRREVLKTLLVSTATSLIGGKLWAAQTVSDVTPAIDPTIGIARFAVSGFPALAIDGGSVRLGSFGFLLDAGPLKPIIINRVSATEFAVLDSQCPHRGCVVNPYDRGSGLVICPCHGSQFDIRGNLVQGPAPLSLYRYDSFIANGILEIQLLDYGFDVTQTLVLNGAQQRLQLSAHTLPGVEYEVRFGTDLKSLPASVPFAQTLSGEPGNGALHGDGTVKSAYVIPKPGFYQLACRMTQV
jgi:Rieske Fe-S protein